MLDDAEPDAFRLRRGRRARVLRPLAVAWLAACFGLTSLDPALAQSPRKRRLRSPPAPRVVRTAPAPATAPQSTGSQLAMQFINTEITEVIDYVARATGTSFIYGDQVRGKISMTGGTLVSHDEALEMLRLSLSLLGFGALTTPGGPLRIVKTGTAVTFGEWTTGEVTGGESPILTIVRLKAALSSDVLLTIRPMVGSSAVAIDYESTNALILGGSESRLRRLIQIIQALDEKSLTGLVVRRLHNATAIRAAEMLETAIHDPHRESQLLQVWADERINAVLLLGPENVLTRANRLLDDIDRADAGLGEIHVIPVRNTDPEALAEILRSMEQQQTGDGDAEDDSGPLSGRGFRVVVDPPTRSLVVMADPETARTVRDVVARLDHPAPRVSIDVIITEINRPTSYRLGFAAFIPFGTQDEDGVSGGAVVLNPRGGGLQSTPSGDVTFISRGGRDPLSVTATGPDGDDVTLNIAREQFALVAGNRSIDTRVLMRPHLLMSSGEQRELFAGTNVPIARQSTDTTGANPLQIQQTIDRQDVGLTLRVSPTVGETGLVRMEILVEETRVVASIAGDIEEVGPTIRQRQVESTISLRDGQFAIIASHSDPRTENLVSGVPLLKDLPVIGWIFRDTSEQATESQLIVAVQVRVHRTREDILAESIRRRIGFQRSLERLDELESGAPYAVHITTSDYEADASEIAAGLREIGEPAEVVSWSRYDQDFYDVFLTGFESIADAGAAALRVGGRGWKPEVVALPQR